MGEANENRFRRSNSSSRAMDVMDCFSLETNRHPGDLLQRFASTFDAQQHKIRPTSEEEEDKEEIELNLGLSLGGRFGVDKTAKKLIRSSSIADVLSATSPVSYHFLTRTSSLPIETEEWRKRKEMQCLRRMQAKRRRCEKQQKNLNANLRSELNFEGERRHLNVNRENWTPAGAKQQRGIGAMNVNRSSNNLRGLGGSQGSVESQGGESSSGMSEMESKPLQRSSSVGEARSTSSDQLVQARSNQDAVGSSRGKTNNNVCRTSGSELENPSTKFDSSENMGREIGADAMEDLPYVFTKGDGPNGRRIEGILYKYGNGEDVRIICVCHGSFLTPMEFIKHAGGGDVDYPLRHIVVNASGCSFGFHNTLSMSPLE